MCDIDIDVRLEEYKIVDQKQIHYRRKQGYDIREVGSVGYFTDEHTGVQYLWIQYFDCTTDERLRVRKDKVIRLGS